VTVFGQAGVGKSRLVREFEKVIGQECVLSNRSRAGLDARPDVFVV